MTREWPKPWSEITPDTSTPFEAITTQYVDLGPIRCYDDTIYVNADAAWEGENRDRWLPLGLYVAGYPTSDRDRPASRSYCGP